MSREGRSADARTQSLYEKGCRLLEAGRPREAAALLARAADRDPDDARVLARLGRALHQDGQMLSALRAYDRIIQLGAATSETWCETGNALADVGEYAQAAGAFERSIELARDNPEAHNNLARVCYRLGDADRAVAHLKIAARQTDALDPWLGLATILPAAPAAKARKILALRARFAERLAQTSPTPERTAPRRALRARGKPRVGYLSAYFHGANYMKPVWGLINRHDRERFEIHLFSDSPKHDGMEGYHPRPEDRVHDVRSLTNGALAERIDACGIDILVDLNAYSTPERLALFLRPPAPIVVAWFNMFASSGLPGFDYIVGDDQVVSRREDALFCEKVVRLPVSYLTFEVTHDAPPVVDPPCLQNGYLTFGSLVSQYKINPRVLDAWAKILRKAGDSRLLVANTAMKSIHNQAWLAQRFSERGIDPDRLSLLGPAAHYEYLKYYDRIDVALDAFPYNGGTTTMEAIWQGVPVLTFDGDRWAARTSQTLLRRTHLAEFVAPSARAMVKQAARLAADASTPGMLRKLRREMRPALEGSSACDTAALARAMEQFFEAAIAATAEL